MAPYDYRVVRLPLRTYERVSRSVPVHPCVGLLDMDREPGERTELARSRLRGLRLRRALQETTEISFSESLVTAADFALIHELALPLTYLATTCTRCGDSVAGCAAKQLAGPRAAHDRRSCPALRDAGCDSRTWTGQVSAERHVPQPTSPLHA